MPRVYSPIQTLSGLADSKPQRFSCLSSLNSETHTKIFMGYRESKLRSSGLYSSLPAEPSSQPGWTLKSRCLYLQDFGFGLVGDKRKCRKDRHTNTATERLWWRVPSRSETWVVFYTILDEGQVYWTQLNKEMGLSYTAGWGGRLASLVGWSFRE